MNNLYCKKTLKFLSVFIVVLSFCIIVLAPSYSISGVNSGSIVTDYNDKDSIVKNIVIRKNITDEDLTDYINKKSLPFTIEVFLKDTAKNTFGDFHALVLFNCSFISTFRPSFEYNSLTNSFLMNDMIFDGKSNVLFFAITDGSVNYYKEFLIPIPQAVLSSNQENLGEKDPEGTSGKATITNDKVTEKKIPASLKPHIILAYHKIEFSKTDNLNFDLTLEFFNTSKNIAAENIMLNFTPDKFDPSSLRLYLNNSDNNKYIDIIAPQGKKKVVLSCSLNKDMDIAVYLLEIESDFQYTDKKDESPISCSDKSILTINPTIGGNLRIDSIHIPTDVVVKEDFELEYRVANTGFSPLSNVDILITDSDDKKVATLFLGKISSNQSASSPNIKLNIKKSGTFDLNFKVSYLDEKNKKHTTEKVFTLKVAENIADINGLDVELNNPTIIIEKQSQRFDSSFLTGAVLSFVILIVLYFISSIFKNNPEKKTAELMDNLSFNSLSTISENEIIKKEEKYTNDSALSNFKKEK